MGGFSVMHLLLFGLVAILLFGRGRISDLMEDVGKGIKSFKKGIADEEPVSLKPIAHVEGQTTPIAPPAQAQPVAPPAGSSGEMR